MVKMSVDVQGCFTHASGKLRGDHGVRELVPMAARALTGTGREDTRP